MPYNVKTYTHVHVFYHMVEIFCKMATIQRSVDLGGLGVNL